MIKHDVYRSIVRGCIEAQDSLGEMLANKELVAWGDKEYKRDAYIQLQAMRSMGVIKSEIEIHRKMYPWYSGYAWIDSEEERREDIYDHSPRLYKIVHKSYCIAARYE